ncbi:MAG: hypothetical protein ACJA2F_000448, partial [Nitriliruptoraceae bacterium]
MWVTVCKCGNTAIPAHRGGDRWNVGYDAVRWLASQGA